MVVEADEYDTAFFDKRSKFLHYLPEVVLINNLEFDHACSGVGPPNVSPFGDRLPVEGTVFGLLGPLVVNRLPGF